MKIKKKINEKYTPQEIKEILRNERAKINGVQFELTPSALEYWEGGNHHENKN